MVSVIGSIGAFAILAGFIVLARAARTRHRGGGSSLWADSDAGTLTVVSEVIVGVALVVGGGALLYFALWSEGTLVL